MKQQKKISFLFFAFFWVRAPVSIPNLRLMVETKGSILFMCVFSLVHCEKQEKNHETNKIKTKKKMGK